MNKETFEKYKNLKSDLLDEQLTLAMIAPVVEILKLMFLFSMIFFFVIGIYEIYSSNFNFEHFKNLSFSLLFAIGIYSLLLIFSKKIMFRYLLPKIYFSMKIKNRLFEKGVEQYFDLNDRKTMEIIKSMQDDIYQQENIVGGYTGSLLIEIQEKILKESYQSRNNVIQIFQDKIVKI